MIFALIFLVLCGSSALSQQSCKDEGLFPDLDQCDAYIECRNGVSERKVCPEGLVFDDRWSHFRYPCSYPSDVTCGSRTKLQPPQPTAQCPHQYGMFRSSDSPGDCGSFHSCVGGVSFRFTCPEGLAFSDLRLSCLWPDEVETCNTKAFLGLECPGHVHPVRLLLFGHPRFGHPEDCRRFFTCVNGSSPRIHVCGEGTVYNPKIDTCDDPENVPGCETYYPKEVLEAVRKLYRYREEEENKLN